jgi:hypothetical protein
VSNTVPVLPTPPMSPQTRAILYAVWAWIALFAGIGTAVYGIALPGEPVPTWLIAVSAALNLFGTALGFLAKNNVTSDAAGN